MNALGWTFKFFLIMKEMENWDFMSFYTYYYVFGKSKFKNLSPFLVDFFTDQKKLRIWTYSYLDIFEAAKSYTLVSL